MTDAAIKWPRVNARWLRTAAIGKVFAALAKGGATTRVVGGAVRNALMDRPVKEVDIATTARPAETMRLAKAAGLGAYPTGIDHGTITVVADGHPYEITTLRRDVETDGRHAVVAFTDDWKQDASRRDFTINALYCDLEGNVYDPVGGLEDLRKRRVRFIGDAKERIREDYLRILRFFRFSAQYGNGQIDPTGLAAAEEMKEGMSLLSAERVRAEMLKLLAAPGAPEVLAVMYKAGILQLVVRTRLEPDRFERFAAIEAALGEAPDPVTRLAALAVIHPGDDRFLAAQLKLSNAEASRIGAVFASEPGIDPHTPETTGRAALYKLGPENFKRAVLLAWARSDASPNDPVWRARALLPDRWKAPKMPVSGSDVIALGFAPGPAIGGILQAFEKWWVGNNFPSDAEQQRTVLKELANKALA
ncbi:CCA tRNA nucleotidyltransferase [Hyphomicrobium sp.]|uniref:CCA tRNA nucleotidyltransferase n=1 Tax=Hyphomicrobium sp. TaxID=82 RepID=UPI002D775EAF|nr:CCA tRNA nucleotidyltransferase [Hyphomicrobium sp.]HET6390155.1 CCA tRNA nucleotidyltransferase [Hyphomicrobium sp.]